MLSHLLMHMLEELFHNLFEKALTSYNQAQLCHTQNHALFQVLRVVSTWVQSYACMLDPIRPVTNVYIAVIQKMHIQQSSKVTFKPHITSLKWQ